MNIGITTSFVISGILLLSILSFNQAVVQNSVNTTRDVMARQNLEAVKDIFSNDMQRLSFQVPEATDHITVATSQQFGFRGDLYDNDGAGFNNITWSFDSTSNVTSTQNPDDHVLIRTEDGNAQTLSVVVTDLEFSYFNANGNELATPVPASDLEFIRGIEMNITCESADPYDDEYQVVHWQQKFLPTNLQL